jgi:hypothetical protein
MEHSENYVVFGIVSALTGFWHAAALLLILRHQAFGWVLGVFSRKLPHQVDTAKLDSTGIPCLGRNVSGGTWPRLSWGRSVL